MRRTGASDACRTPRANADGTHPRPPTRVSPIRRRAIRLAAGLLAFHGVPACGAGFAWADDPARARGLRLIAPDRPGVGLSTGRAVGFAVRDYPPMISALADTLGIGRFAAFGYSGGGPYAVACAMALPERVTAAVAAGVGQVGAWATLADFAKTDRQYLEMAERHPRRAGVML